MQAITSEANQIFRRVTEYDYGIDGEIELKLKDNDGRPSGERIYVQLKSGNSSLRTRRADGCDVFDVKNDRHLTYWISQPGDVYLVIRQADERTVTRYLKNRPDPQSCQIVFEGEPPTMEAVWKVRDEFFPARHARPDVA
ncbi:MAG: DUF4365 domain-containing protein [Bryobacteraceae bacterium]